MPKIVEFDAPINLFHAEDRGQDAWSRAGARIGELGSVENQLAQQEGRALGQAFNGVASGFEQMQQRSEEAAGNQEVQTGTQALALGSFNIINQYNQGVKGADPNDPNAIPNLLQNNILPQMDKLGAGFTTPKGQKMYQEWRNKTLDHLTTMGLADRSVQAGQAFEQGTQTALQATINTASSDAASYDYTRQQGLDIINARIDATPGLTPDQVAKAKGDMTTKFLKEHANATIYAEAQANPAAALHDVDSGRFNVDGVDLMEARKAIGVVQAQKEKAQNAADTAQKKANEAEFDKVATGLVSAFTPPKGQGIDPKAMDALHELNIKASSLGITPSKLQSLNDYANRQIKVQAGQADEQVTDPATYESMKDRMYSTTNPLTTQDIYSAMAGRNGHLDAKAGRLLLDAVKDAGDPANKGIASKIKTLTGKYKDYITNTNPFQIGKDPWGAQRWGEFQMNTELEVQSYMKQGKTLDQAIAEVDKAISTGHLKDYQITADQARQEQDALFSQQTATPLAAVAPKLAEPAPGTKLPNVAPTVANANKIMYQPGESADALLDRINKMGTPATASAAISAAVLPNGALVMPKDPTLPPPFEGNLPTLGAKAVTNMQQFTGATPRANALDRITIQNYLSTGGYGTDLNGQPLMQSNEAWCAAITNATLASVGIKGLQGDRRNVATSFLSWGRPVVAGEQVQAGDVVVISRGLKAGDLGGHVGIATGNVQGKGGMYNAIISAEGTAKYNDPYNTSLGYLPSPMPLTKMTLDQALDWGEEIRAAPRNAGLDSSAKGAFQIVNKTQVKAMAALGMKGDELFDEAHQQRMADWIMKHQGSNAWAGFKLHGDQRAIAEQSFNEPNTGKIEFISGNTRGPAGSTVGTTWISPGAVQIRRATQDEMGAQ